MNDSWQGRKSGPRIFQAEEHWMRNLRGKKRDQFGELQGDKVKAVFLKTWSCVCLSQNHLGVILKSPGNLSPSR